MRICHLLCLVLCLSDVYGQRTRTANSNDEAPKEAQTVLRGRGKARFSSSEEFAEISNAQIPNRRVSITRTKTHSGNTKASSERRSRPTIQPPPKSYSVQEVNNDSPIDTFVRQSKPRVLIEDKFDVTPASFGGSSTVVPLVSVDEIGLGNTARAILQARGETPPPKTTTPVVDETYLLNNFGSTIRTLAAASRSVQQRPVLRAETRLPPLRNAEIAAERQRPLARSRTRSQKPKETERRVTTEKTVVEEFSRLGSETEATRVEELDAVTEAVQFLEDEQLSDALTNPRSTSPPTTVTTTTKRTSNGGRRVVTRTRSRVTEEDAPEISVTPRARLQRINRRKVEDADVAESNYSASPVFVTTKPRTGRRIDSLQVEGFSSRSSGRRTEVASTTEKSSRGRGRSRSEPVTSTASSARSRSSDEGRRSQQNNRRRPNSRTEPQTGPTIPSRSRSRYQEAPSPVQTTPYYGEKSILPTSTAKSQRSRTKQLDTPPNIDESRLEVLPLFEREPKTLRAVIRSRGRSRPAASRRISDHMHVSATENDVQVAQQPSENFTSAIVSAISSTTKSSPTTKASKRVKESVVSEVNQVISKSSIIRRKKVPKAKAVEILSRGGKKPDVKLSKRKGSEEEIAEDDNYPEPFKALIHAKKIQDESKSNQSVSSRNSMATAKSTSSQKPFLTTTTTTDAPRNRPSSARTATTALPRKSKEFHGNINDVIDNEVGPKSYLSTRSTVRPTRSRQLPKFSEKPTRPKEKSSKLATETSSMKTTTTKPTTKTYATRASPYSPKSGFEEHHSRRKTLRSTALPPSTTPLGVLSKDVKFSAKFVEKKSQAPETGTATTEKVFKVVGKSPSKSKQLDASLIQPIKKLNASRYSSRYRGDTSTRSTVLKTTTSAPFYIPTIPTPAYVPTVPTVTPPAPRIDDGIVAVKDRDLGVEVISFDDATNTVPSADLVNGEYLTTDKNLKLSPMVKNGTTEKPISIIERIINSITMISTTAAPSATASTPVTAGTTENSAILKLASKKPSTLTRPDVRTSSNIIETITSEKPTTIIEKIRSSLSAIQTNEVGTAPGDDGFSSSAIISTTPLSAATTHKYSARFRGGSSVGSELPAPQPLSTTSPLSVFDRIDENQVLEKQTIGKLLDILNGLVSTTAASQLVVVTPKSATVPPAGFVSTTFSPQEPIEAVTFTTEPTVNTVNTDLPSTTSTPDTTETLLSTAATVTTESIPPTFQVSPGSVSIFSANDLFNLVTHDDNSVFNTVTIPSRVGFDNNVLTSTTVPSTSTEVDITTTTTMETATSTEAATTTMLTTTTATSNTTATSISSSNTTASARTGKILSNDVVNEPLGNGIEAVSSATPTSSTTPDYFIFAVLNNNTVLRKRPPAIPNKDVPFVVVGLFPNNTVVRKFPNGTVIPMDPVIKVRGFDIRPDPPPLVEITSNQVTDTANGSTTSDNNPPVTVESNRMARLLETNTSPPRVVVTSTTSIPPTSTAKRFTTTPIPVNPQTTVSPSEMVEIVAVPAETRISKSQTTTPQVETTTSTTNGGSAVESSTLQMSSSTISQVTETVPPSLGEILNGRTVDAFNSLIRSESSPSTDRPNYKTLQINQYNEVLNIQDLISRINGDVVYRWKPVTKNEYNGIKSSIGGSTTSVPQTTIGEVSTPLSTMSSTVLSTTPLLSTDTDRLLESNKVLPSTTTVSPSTTITTTAPSTTTTTSTTSQPSTTTKRTTTNSPPPSFTPASILPTILTTLFPNLLNRIGPTQDNRVSTTNRPRFINDEFSNNILDGFEVLSAAGTTAQPTAVLAQTPTASRISTTTLPTTSTTTSTTTTPAPPRIVTTTTTTPKPTTTATKSTTSTNSPPTTIITTNKPVQPSNKEETDKLFEELKKSGKLNNLNEEQKRNLMEIEKIEKEQAELLKQLRLLTTMFGNQNVRAPHALPIPNPVTGSNNHLANRIIAMAMERDKSRASSAPLDITTTTTATIAAVTTTARSSRKRPNSIQDQLLLTDVEDATKKTTPSLEDVLKQYNLNGLTTKAPLTSTYGKTDEAILAAILKEHGIGPTTPKTLGERVKEAGVFEEVPVARRPKSTTARPVGGRLMQGLNWLLDVLDPPTTKKPSATRAPRSKTAAKNSGADEELLTNQPTRITPMVTAAPVTKSSLSQDEIQGLIKQLEAVQSNPNAVDQLDFSKIKSLQNLINVNEGVQVTHAGQHGATSRATPRPRRLTSTTERDPLLAHINTRPRFSTLSTLSVSNSIEDVETTTTSTARTRALPPVSLNPVPGIDDQQQSGESGMIRSNLLTAAVNVTRAISSFLGSAIQDAAQQVRNAFYTGSSGVLSGLSAGSSVPSLPGLSSGPSVNGSS